MLIARVGVNKGRIQKQKYNAKTQNLIVVPSITSFISQNTFSFRPKANFSTFSALSSPLFRTNSLSTHPLFFTRSKDKNKNKKGGKGGKDDEEEGPAELDLVAVGEKMEKSISSFSESIANYRIERASPALLENVEVEEQLEGKKKGNKVLLQHLCNVSVLDSKTLLVQVPDASLIKTVSKAILAQSGLNPEPGDATSIKVPLPKASTEYKEQLVKQINKSMEEYKESLRRARRDAIEQLKSMKASKDDVKRNEKLVQDLLDKKMKVLTDRATAKINELSRS